MRLHTFAASIAATGFLCLLSGCSAQFDSVTPSTDHAALQLQGQVHGGRQPIVGAHVYVFAAGTGGNAGTLLSPVTANQSMSLLTSVTTGAFPTLADGNNDYYVTTDATGSFTLTNEYSCMSGQQVYLYALGGKPDGVTTNAVSGLLGIIGTCPAGGTFSATVPFIFLNEVSTVAAAYSMAGYATDVLHVSSDAGVNGNATIAAQAKAGVANAFASAASLSNITTGSAALATTPNGYGTVPQSKLNLLADILAACINSTGSASAPCTTLFNNATNNGVFCSSSCTNHATDTASAAINIAHYPSAAMAAALYFVPSAVMPFNPTPASQPNDLTVAISYTGAFSSPTLAAVDGAGNVWLPNNNNTFSIIDSTGAPVVSSVASGNAASITIDSSGNGWIANYSGSYVKKYSVAGSLLATSASTGLTNPILFCGDGSGNLYVPGNTSQDTIKLNSDASYNATFGSDTAGGGYMFGVLMCVVDNSGNIWTGSQGDKLAISKFSSSLVYQTYTAATNSPNYLAADSASNVWIVTRTSQLQKLNSAGTSQGIFTGGGINYPLSVAVDGNNYLYLANLNGASISVFDNSGNPITSSTGYNGLSSPQAAMIDGSGNVWAVNSGNSTVTKFIGLAAPVVMPLSYAAGQAKLGTRP